MKDTSTPLFRAVNIHKSFSGNSVLKGVSLELNKGEVHAIVGGNGAGKSTLMKIITGLYKADSGDLEVSGEVVTFSSPADAHSKGIYLVPQEPLIFPNMNVQENILIGLPGKKQKLIPRINLILEQLDWKVDLQRSASTLSIAEQQLVEILRGLTREAKILILDEPTSTLTFSEIDSLFKTIKRLMEDGLGVFYITHRFPEIFTLSHTVSILRDGFVSSQGPTTEFTYETLLQGLAPVNSHRLYSEEMYKENEFTKTAADSSPVLSVKNLCGSRFHDISFELTKGEILGIAGVVGAGRTELAEAIFGLTKVTNGTISLCDEVIDQLSVRRRIHKGLVYVPEDRQQHGVFSITSIQSNISSTLLHRWNGTFIPFQKEKTTASLYMKNLKIIATTVKQKLSNLSGGNQQKVVLSKYLASEPMVIILDEPTRGIDVNARNDIYRIIKDLKAAGLAVILITSDIEEIEKLSDRVLIMHQGKTVNILSKEEITKDAITSFAFGAKNGVVG
ncbi:sugar ABC transporter ATP-binding protein [Fictibacillus halophilus]|uniref:sugar ABC transporter ATP-binding protein n=1 Tax=Fictibacillus halophilus TaxID=1610490 RepID=UPI0036340283